ncbi:MAG: response regulator transcription factor [Nocardioides sp.]|nr:response regulator transcription factor [Nocardioides sp.]
MIDDQAQFAEVVRATMGKDPDFEAIGHATNLADGLDLIETFEPDLVAVNGHIGPGDGVAAIAQISERHPNVRVVVLAEFASAQMMQRAVAANARAFHPKDAGPARLVWLLLNTGQVGFTMHPEVLHRLITGGPLSPEQEGSASPTVTSRGSLGDGVLGVSRQVRWGE